MMEMSISLKIDPLSVKLVKVNRELKSLAKINNTYQDLEFMKNMMGLVRMELSTQLEANLLTSQEMTIQAQETMNQI